MEKRSSSGAGGGGGNPWSYLFLVRSTADGQHLSRLFSFNLHPTQFMGHNLNPREEWDDRKESITM